MAKKRRYLPAWDISHQSAGEYYGYSKCCVDSFINGRHAYRMSITDKIEMERKFGKNTGYIPCVNCLALPTSVVLDTIRANRDARARAFPNG